MAVRSVQAGGAQGSRLHYSAGRDTVAVRNRLAYAFLALLFVFGAGVVGYWLMGAGEWSWLDCAYMVLTTITTVGYGEIVPVRQVPYGRAFTMGVVVAGVGVSLYFFSALTAFIIEGDLREALWRRKMQRRLDALEGHFVVCGAGRTGRHVIDEIVEAGRVVVVVERDQAELDRLAARHGERFIGVVGDATEDAVLREAGVERAAGIVTSLHSDQDNLFVSLSARQLNPTLRVVSRGIEDRAAGKLRQAGADVVVSPDQIGGKRMAQELMRPNIVGFLDLIVRDEEHRLDIEEITVPETSPLVGVKLAASRIREVSNALVLAATEPGGKQHYNPPPDFKLVAGMRLMVLGERHALERLQRHVAGGQK
ncbi:MAG: potassium channel protein [Myxococcales bacterium]|nr:potassium channel protein [Myxococcales bacterium]